MAQNASATDAIAAAFDESDDTELVKQRKRKAACSFMLEAFFYILFVAMFCAAATNSRPTHAFDIAETARIMFVEADYSDPSTGRLMTLNNVSTIDEIYGWLSETLVPTAFPNENFFSSGQPITPYGTRLMYGQNFRLGTVRLRQLRVKAEEGCSVSRVAADIITSCWPEYQSKYEDTVSFGPPSNRTKYRFRTADELCSEHAPEYCKAIIFGRKGAAYSANGFNIDLPTDQDDANDVIEELKADRWLDYASRVLIVDVTFYNPSVRVFVAVEIVIEIWPTGSVVISYSTKPIPSMRLDDARDYVLLLLEIALIVFVVIYFGLEIRQATGFFAVQRSECVKCVHDRTLSTGVPSPMRCPGCKKREFFPIATPQCPQCHIEVSLGDHNCWRGYVYDPWNVVDLAAQCLFIAVFVIRQQIRASISSIDFSGVGDGFVLLYPLAWQYVTADWIYSIMAFILFAKLFKYLGRLRPLATLVRTLDNAKMELFYFMVIFFALFLGFAFAFYLAFGTDIWGYSSWGRAMLYLFQLLLGAVDYNALSRSNRLLAPVYLILYVLFVFFVLANVFIAIISASHEEALNQLRRDKDDFLSNAIKLRVNSALLSLARLFKQEGRALSLVSSFAARLATSPALTQIQRDNMRAFIKELEADIFTDAGKELMAHIVLSLTAERMEKSREEMTQLDFVDLGTVVKEFKQFKRLEDDAAVRGISQAEFRQQQNDIIDKVLGPIIVGSKEEPVRDLSVDDAPLLAISPAPPEGPPPLVSRDASVNLGAEPPTTRARALLASALGRFDRNRTATVADVEVVLDDVEARQVRAMCSGLVPSVGCRLMCSSSSLPPNPTLL